MLSFLCRIAIFWQFFYTVTCWSSHLDLQDLLDNYQTHEQGYKTSVFLRELMTARDTLLENLPPESDEFEPQLSLFQEYYDAFIEHKRLAGRLLPNKPENDYEAPFFKYNSRGTLELRGFVKVKNKDWGDLHYAVWLEGRRVFDKPANNVVSITLEDGTEYFRPMTRTERKGIEGNNSNKLPHQHAKRKRARNIGWIKEAIGQGIARNDSAVSNLSDYTDQEQHNPTATLGDFLPDAWK